MPNIEDYIRNNFPSYEITAEGNECRIDCIKCGDTNGHLYINLRSGKGYCHRCSTSYISLAYFIMRYEKISLSKAQSIANRYIKFYKSEEVKSLEKAEVEISLPFSNLVRADDTSISGRSALDYLINVRGLNLFDISFHKIRYGLSPQYFGMVIFPITEDNSIVYFCARAFDSDLATMEKRFPKKGVETILGKSDVVFNLDRVDRGGQVVVTEGPFDAIRIGKTGVALLGKDLSLVQCNKILKKRPNEIVVMLDSDAHEYTLKAASIFSQYHRNVKYVLLDKGDPGETPRIKLDNLIQKATSYSWDKQLIWKMAKKNPSTCNNTGTGIESY